MTQQPTSAPAPTTQINANTATKMNKRVLVFDDEPDVAKAHAAKLNAHGLDAIPVAVNREIYNLTLNDAGSLPLEKRARYGGLTYGIFGPKQLQQLFSELKPAAILSDMGMPGFEGDHLVNAAKNINPNIPCIVHSSMFPRLGRADLTQGSNFAAFSKSEDTDVLVAYLNKQLEQARTPT